MPSYLFSSQNPTYTNSFLFMDILVITLCVTITFGMCYLSDFIADKISSHGELSYDLNWYQLPAELRSYFLLIIVQAQAPIQFSGFDIIDMHLKTFTQVSKSISHSMWPLYFFDVFKNICIFRSM